LLITGAIAAMISTADSLLILSATELSESLLKKKGPAGSEGNSKTIFWISAGFEQNYKVSEVKTDLLVKQSVISQNDAGNLLTLEGQRFVSASKFEETIRGKINIHGREETLQKISSAYISKGVPARLTTFIFALIVAVLSTLRIQPAEKKTNMGVK
jgi:sodium/proline symporter